MRLDLFGDVGPIGEGLSELRTEGESLLERLQAEKAVMTRDISETHSELLRDPKVAAAYLSEALQEGNAAVIQMALRDIVEAQEDGGAGLLARLQLDPGSVQAMLSESDSSQLTCFTKLVQGLGLTLKAEA